MMNPAYYNNPNDSTQGWAIKAKDYDYFHSVNCWVDTAEYYYSKPFYLSQSFDMDTILPLIFQYYDSVLLRAARESLKVLLNIGVAYDNYSDYFMENYSKYLALVGQHYSSASTSDSIRQAILAYIILEEPCKSWIDTTMWPRQLAGHSKQDVCNHVTKWYDTLKHYDPNHLITTGITPFDFFEFDPGVMKLDFISPHIYPQKLEFQDENAFQEMVDQVHGWFYWMASTIPMPYLIGETGFKSKYHDSLANGNHGTNIQQKLYADSTLKIAKDCFASGYSWWYFQDYHWSDWDCYFGLYGRDPENSGPTVEKYVVNAFRDFNSSTPPGTFQKPGSYYDPYLNGYYAAMYGYNTSNYLHGHVQNQYGHPLENVYVRGQTRLKGIAPDTVKMYSHHTFTDKNGNFVLIPFDYDTAAGPDYNVIETLKITSPGCSRIDIANWGPNGITDYGIYVLDYLSFSYFDTIENIFIDNNDKKRFQAWENLVLHDSVFVHGDGDFIAREEISIENDFQAFFGSETWIYNDPTFPMCDSIQSVQEVFKSKEIFAERESEIKSDQIELSFSPLRKSAGILVFPNPSDGTFTVQIPEEMLTEDLTITVLDEMSRFITTIPAFSEFTKINLPELPVGMYYLVVKTGSNSTSCKFIIQ